MKLLTSIITVVLMSTVVYSQNAVLRKIDAIDYKAQKAYFVYRDFDKPDLDNFKKILSENWKICPMEFLSIDEYLNFEVPVNSFVFVLGYYHKQYITSRGTTSNYIFISLNVLTKSEEKLESLGRIVISPTGNTIKKISVAGARTEMGNDIILELYRTEKNYSWSLPYLATMISNVSYKLENQIVDSQAKEKKETVKPNNSFLKSEKLYMNSNLNINQNRMNGKEKVEDKSAGIAKQYTHSFELASDEKLNELFMSGDLKYLLMYQKSGDGGILLVLDLVNQEIIYIEKFMGRYSFAPKMLANFAKTVR